MEAIILAGGLGTRLASRLEDVPKAMAPIAGRPFLEILLSQLQRAGCTRVILSVGHLHHLIRDHFGVAFEEMRLDYSIESSPLGTGGAIRLALPQAVEPAVLVLNGDTFLDADYAAMLRFHAAENATATMAVIHRPDIARYGGVVINQNHVVAFEEKGRSGSGWINAGAYVLSTSLDWPAGLGERFSIETDFFVPEVAQLRPAAYEVSGYFLDIGIPEDFDRAQTELAGFLK
jgi:D-glycero-alpha-D-manno-heptose 1-phosphate guanylyltransferase